MTTDPRQVRTCRRTGTVGFHPEPHQACRSRFFRALRRRRWA